MIGIFIYLAIVILTYMICAGIGIYCKEDKTYYAELIPIALVWPLLMLIIICTLLFAIVMVIIEEVYSRIKRKKV